MSQQQLSNAELIQVWLHHNELRWRVLMSSPVFCATVLVGWYSIEVSGFPLLSNLILCLGIIGMFAYYLLMRRLGDFAADYNGAIQGAPKVRPPFAGIPTYLVGLVIPILLACVFIILFFVEIPVRAGGAG